MRPSRLVLITVRTGHDFKPDLFGRSSKAYVVIELGDKTVSTSVVKTGGANPVWDEQLSLEMPPLQPGAPSPTLLIRVMQPIRFFPDSLLASGNIQLTELMFGGGSHEVSIPLSDRTGKEWGHLHVGIVIPPTEQLPGSAAGKVLAEGIPPAKDQAADVPRADATPTTTTLPVTPLSDAIVGGGIMNPAQPSYGVML